jgi:hypothetical protein
METPVLAHITPTDIGLGLGLFALGVVVGAILVARWRSAVR